MGVFIIITIHLLISNFVELVVLGIYNNTNSFSNITN